MKVADSTMPIIFLELVAGIIFLSVIFLAVVLIEDRLGSLSLSSQPITATPTSDGGKSSVMEGWGAALATLEQKIDILSAQKKAVLPSLPTPSQDQIDAMLQKRLDEITPKFEALESNMQRLFAPRQDLGGITLKAVEGVYPLSPIVGDLQKKVDFLSLEHEKTISPTLTILTDKVDQLLLARAKSLALLVGEPENSSLINDEAIDDDIWDLESEESNPDISTLNAVNSVPLVDVSSPVIVKPVLVVEPDMVKPTAVPTASELDVTKHVKDILAQYGVESTIDLGNNGLLLPAFFDFSFGSSELSQEQIGEISILADALTEVFLCYANTKDPMVMESCQKNQQPVTLKSVFLKVFSVGSNVGTQRFKYNWELANARSVKALKALVTARPDLLTYTNADGDSLFQTIAQLLKTGARRTRRMELHFVISK
jgi:hypothetical protein